MGNYNFILCTPTPKCRWPNESFMNTSEAYSNLTDGCYLMMNCSQATMDDTTIVSMLTLEEKHYFDSDGLFDFELEQDHYTNFVQKNE